MGRVLEPSEAKVQDLTGKIAVVDDCVMLTESGLGKNLPIVWPEGTAVADEPSNEISLMNGTFRIGDEISPARGWTTTIDELPSEIVEGLNTPCNTGMAESAIVISRVGGMPAQE